MDTSETDSLLRRLGDWLRWRNPLLHGLVAALALDIAADLLWGNGTVNISIFLAVVTVVTTGSFLGQRRLAKRILAQRPLPPGQPVDSDGTPLSTVLAFVNDSDEPDWEWLWARPLDQHGLYRIRSIPVVAEGLARNDIVSCVETHGGCEVVAVVERGGHRTIHVRFVQGVMVDGESGQHDVPAALKSILDMLPLEQSVVAGTTEGRYAIDVHPEDDYDKVAARLDELERGNPLTWCESAIAGDPSSPHHHPDAPQPL